MKKEGISVVFISHKLDEMMDITDRITILNNVRLIEFSVYVIQGVMSALVGVVLTSKLLPVILREQLRKLAVRLVCGKILTMNVISLPVLSLPLSPMSNFLTVCLI